MVFHNSCYAIGEIADLIEHRHKYSDVLRYSTFTLITAGCILGLIGNSIVIFFTIFVMKKNKSKIWFLNLAVNDIMSLILMPFQGFAILGGKWCYGPHVCKIFLFVIYVNIYANVFSLIALNISRALSVAKPMFHQKFISYRVSCRACVVIWMITLLASLPVLYFGGEFRIGESTYCTFMSSKDFETKSFDPAYNVTDQHLAMQNKLYLNTYEKYRHLFMGCSTEKCCPTKDTVARWNNLVFTFQFFTIPFMILGYVIPLCVLIFSNITIAIQVQKSHTVNAHRLYRIVIAVIVVYFVTWTPTFIGEVMLMFAVMNGNLIVLCKWIIFMPFFCSIGHTNCAINPILYVLVGRQARTSLADFMSSLRSSLRSIGNTNSKG
ncbi:chemerin-like receptor 1 [Hyperolius riggenbachi]|uniref:chemerin-like receptor 1 n=1 Tax=Hyperolius riggenbachi TaxID=752182 RepID=UPI0035A2CD61